MDQATMRARFKERLAGIADGESDAGIDVWLDEAYQYTIPDEVPGLLTDGDYTVTTVAGTQDYAYPVTVHSVRRGAQIDDRAITTYFRAAEMWDYNDRSDTTQAKPHSALFFDDQLTLFPVPDAAYTIWIPCREYPSAGLTTGLTNETHAKAVIAAAVLEYALDKSLEDISAREAARFQAELSRLKRRSSATVPESRPSRTF